MRPDRPFEAMIRWLTPLKIDSGELHVETTSLTGAQLKALGVVSTHNLGPVATTYLGNATPLSNIEGTILLAVPSEFTKAWVESKASSEVAAAPSETLGKEIRIAIATDPSFAAEDDEAEKDGSTTPVHSPAQSAISATQSPASASAPTLTPATAARAPADFGGQLTRLNSKYTFDTFVIGPSNRFAHAAALAASESPGSPFNPLFIYGDSGLGKTHLLHAIGHYAFSLYSKLKVRYVSSEEFANEFINAIRLSKTDNSAVEEFHRRHRELDILLIDDIQFVRDKEQTMEGFFHTFNTLYEADKQVVITSDVHPNYLNGFEERLASRLGLDFLVDVQPPDPETHIAILQKKAATDALEIQPEVFKFITSRVSSNIRELEGALVRVVAYASLTKKHIDISLAEMMLKDYISDPDDNEITVALIMSQYAAYFGVTIDQLCSMDRSYAVVEARQIAIYLCHELTDLSLPKTDQVFGRDHTTVIHASKKIPTLVKEKRETFNHVSGLANRIKKKAWGG